MKRRKFLQHLFFISVIPLFLTIYKDEKIRVVNGWSLKNEDF